ncbi:RNA-binding protein [Mongoliimonas terrestris]|uniref:RNA-binding protein n=1 Tax=Mongoliimonas terrestris TaxID=1709001 RepID=UPI0009499D0C|nr:RNA-binding protein [Mongoliimonas terrestris]
MAPKRDESERTCLVTRATGPSAGLIRFVRGPDGQVVPDLKGKLPGRGVWLTGRRTVVAEAVKKRAFSRGFKAETETPADLPDLVDRLMADAALGALSMARKAGKVVTGFGKVTSALGRGQAVAVIHAVEAADDGRRKVAQVMRRRARAEAGLDDEAGYDEDDDESDLDALERDGLAPDDGLEVDDDADPGSGEPGPRAADGGSAIDPALLPRVIGGIFTSRELDLALGGANVIHAALLAGGASTSFLHNAAALARYRGAAQDTDWTAGL